VLAPSADELAVDVAAHSGSPAFQGAAPTTQSRATPAVLLLDKLGRTTLDRVAADVQEGSAHGVLARTTKPSSRSSQRTIRLQHG
jgi:hypothetical protein